jgi:hypothetical protein
VAVQGLSRYQQTAQAPQIGTRILHQVQDVYGGHVSIQAPPSRSIVIPSRQMQRLGSIEHYKQLGE